MDLTIKAKPFELEALEYLNQNSPCLDLYKGKKYPGFQWAVTLAAEIDTIEWKRYSKIKLENYFTGESFENSSEVTHLAVDEEAYGNVATSIKEYFNLTRVQNAFVIRCVLKYAVSVLKNEKEDDILKLNFFCKNQLLILEKLEEIIELLKNDRNL